MQPLAKVFMGVGALVFVIGAIMWVLSIYAPGIRLFRLPGDVVLEQGDSRVFVPFTTMLVISAVITLVLIVAGWLRR